MKGTLHDGTKGDDVGKVGKEDEQRGGQRLGEATTEEVRKIRQEPGQFATAKKINKLVGKFENFK
jgi:hypothetical protein